MTHRFVWTAEAKAAWDADLALMRREHPYWPIPAWSRAPAWRRRPYLVDSEIPNAQAKEDATKP